MKLLTKSQYPTSLKVKDEEYRVAFVADIAGDNTVGQCDPGNRVIHIENGQSREEMLKTFIHETLHALEFEYDIKISHKAIYKLEIAIFNFIRDNF